MEAAPSNDRSDRYRKRDEERKSRKLFIGGVSFDTNDEDFFKYFARFGELEDCVLIREKDTQQSRGFGFVTYKDKKISEHVATQQLYLDGRRLDPKPSISRYSMDKIHEHRNQTTKVFVGGLHDDTVEAELSDYFQKFGRILEVNIMCDRFTNAPRGFGFVTFEKEDVAEKVIDWTEDHMIHNKKVDCKPATARKDAFSSREPPRQRENRRAASREDRWKRYHGDEDRRQNRYDRRDRPDSSYPPPYGRGSYPPPPQHSSYAYSSSIPYPPQHSSYPPPPPHHYQSYPPQQSQLPPTHSSHPSHSATSSSSNAPPPSNPAAPNSSDPYAPAPSYPYYPYYNYPQQPPSTHNPYGAQYGHYQPPPTTHQPHQQKPLTPNSTNPPTTASSSTVANPPRYDYYQTQYQQHRPAPTSQPPQHQSQHQSTKSTIPIKKQKMSNIPLPTSNNKNGQNSVAPPIIPIKPEQAQIPTGYGAQRGSTATNSAQSSRYSAY